MGEVYEAEDTVKDRIVALKLLPESASHDPVFRKRLLDPRAVGRAVAILKNMQKQCGVKNLMIDPQVKGTGTFRFREVPCRQHRVGAVDVGEVEDVDRFG